MRKAQQRPGWLAIRTDPGADGRAATLELVSAAVIVAGVLLARALVTDGSERLDDAGALRLDVDGDEVAIVLERAER